VSTAIFLRDLENRNEKTHRCIRLEEVKSSTMLCESGGEGASDEKSHDNEGEVTVNEEAQFNESES